MEGAEAYKEDQIPGGSTETKPFTARRNNVGHLQI